LGGNIFLGKPEMIPTMQNYRLNASVVLLCKLYILSLIRIVQLNHTVCWGLKIRIVILIHILPAAMYFFRQNRTCFRLRPWTKSLYAWNIHQLYDLHDWIGRLPEKNYYEFSAPGESYIAIVYIRPYNMLRIIITNL
jgi:hypothetical protein